MVDVMDRRDWTDPLQPVISRLLTNPAYSTYAAAYHHSYFSYILMTIIDEVRSGYLL